MKDPAWRPVLSELRNLYEAAGRPSYRRLGQAAQLAHTTVHNALTGNGPAGLKWSTVDGIARALGADSEALRPLYDKIAAGRPARNRHSQWRQNVVAAAKATAEAHRVGDEHALHHALVQLQGLLSRQP